MGKNMTVKVVRKFDQVIVMALDVQKEEVFNTTIDNFNVIIDHSRFEVVVE